MGFRNLVGFIPLRRRDDRSLEQRMNDRDLRALNAEASKAALDVDEAGRRRELRESVERHAVERRQRRAENLRTADRDEGSVSAHRLGEAS